MKAVVYNGPRDVGVKNVGDASVEQATNVVVRISTTNICGSDLHMYEHGRRGLRVRRHGPVAGRAS